MRKYSSVVVSVVCFVFMMWSCEGPMGPAGNDGNDGKDANTSCLVCHTKAKQNTLSAQYHLSKHFTGTTSARNTKYCAGCHTHEGFKEITENGKFVVASEIPMATRINCETCHKHTGFDFSVDTLTEILSTTSPVYLHYNKNKTATDFGATNNLCVTCHQIRGATSLVYTDTTVSPANTSKSFTQLAFFPLDNTKEGTTVKYQVGQSFSVHDGNQSNLFAGINGYEYAGKTYTRTWKHSGNKCTDCHMNEYNPADSTGGHTLKINKTACATCHGSDKITPVQGLITAKRIELAELLVTRKIFKKSGSGTTATYTAMPSHDFYGVLFPTTSTTTAYGIALASANTVGSTSGVLVYANKVTFGIDKDYATRIGREWKYGELGAAYNYGYINSELSQGVHNPTYALQLLQNSIDWLNAN